MFTPGNDFAPASEWDVPPQLDTLLVFRSHDVEHEVLPTSHERMAVTIWYYGKRNYNAKTITNAATTAAEPRPLLIPSNTSAMNTGPDSIFVAIPSYRDSECRHTVDDLLRRAAFPDRVSIGICLQEIEDDDTLAYLQAKYPSDKVRIEFIDYRDAAGPFVARARAQALWRGEEYYLQIDSHMRFRPGWDEFLIHELARCEGSGKPILTTYPLGYTLPNQVNETLRLGGLTLVTLRGVALCCGCIRSLPTAARLFCALEASMTTVFYANQVECCSERHPGTRFAWTILSQRDTNERCCCVAAPHVRYLQADSIAALGGWIRVLVVESD